jgi:hypothetical protein
MDPRIFKQAMKEEKAKKEKKTLLQEWNICKMVITVPSHVAQESPAAHYGNNKLTLYGACSGLNKTVDIGLFDRSWTCGNVFRFRFRLGKSRTITTHNP